LSGYHAIVSNLETGVLLAASSSGLFRSEDEGASWSTVISDGNWTDVKWRPGGADSAYAIREYGGVYVSADGGRSFQIVTAGLPPASAIGGFGKLAPSPSDPRVVYAGFSAADSFTMLGIYRSLDGGSTWTVRSTEPDIYNHQGYYNNTLVVDPQDPGRLFAGGVFLWVSVDSAASWQFLYWDAHVDHHAIGFHSASQRDLWFATDGGIYVSRDGENGCTQRNEGLVTAQFYDICLSAMARGLGYGGTQDNGFLRYVGSPVWTQMTGADGMACNCDPGDPGHVYLEFQYGGHYVSWDRLETLNEINDGLYGTSRFEAPVDLDPSNAARLFTSTRAGMFRTTNGGALWDYVGVGWDVVSISVSPISSRWIWALERSAGLVRVSRDGGDTWTAHQAAPFAGIGGMTILADPADSLSAFCTFLHHPALTPLVLRTRDGGETWEDVTGNLGEQSVNTIAIDPARPLDWYAGTDVGVWYTGNGGASWRPYGQGLPNAVVLDIEIHPASSTLWAATHGRGAWQAPTLSGGAPVVTAQRPLSLELGSANPARAAILLRYAARGGGEARLRIYDVRGRLVADLTSSPADGQVRLATWRGAGVPNGIYFAELRAGERTVTRKLAIVH